MTEKPPPRIWDVHCHLSGVPGRTPEEMMSALMARADRMGIERIIVCMGSPWSADPSADDLKRQNDQVLQALAHWHDRAFGFADVSPKHVETSLGEIDRCIRDGPMVGIKLWIAAQCNVPEIDPIIARAGELRAAILQHTWYKAGGNYPGESTPDDLVELAARHPTVPIICGHTGADWERGVRAIRGSLNLFSDLAGCDPTAGYVEMAVRELGARRVIYGSDAGGRSFATQLAKVASATLSDQDRRAILGGNLRAMLGPILRAKGVPFTP
jgi:predicted TIM-barrel fold metal-dependent hydrolase